MDKIYTIKEVRYNPINGMHYLSFEEGEGRPDRWNINSLDNLSKGLQSGVYELVPEKSFNVKESLSNAFKSIKTESTYYKDRTFIPVEDNTYVKALKAEIKHILLHRKQGKPETAMSKEAEQIIKSDKIFIQKNSLLDDLSIAEFLYQLSLVASKLTEVKNYK